MKKILLLALVFCSVASMAQDLVVDEIIAKVGDHVILRSELMFEVEQANKNYGDKIKDVECIVLQQLILKQMLLNQAELDSLPVGPEQVNNDLDNKLRFYIGQAGSVENLESFLGMSLVEYKEQMRPLIREQLLVRAMRQKIVGDMSASPKEVKAFFATIPSDSLPIYNAEIEIAQLVVTPQVSEVAKKIAYERILKLKKRLDAGEDFKLLASVWSEDRGTAINGGELQEFGRNEMVPAFEKAAFALKDGETSDIVESKYGYHIIQSIYRKGEKLKVRHILIKPKITDLDLLNLKKRMDSAVYKIRTGEIDFCKAVSLYSEDGGSNSNCGYFMDQNTGIRSVEMNLLDPDIVAEVKSMKVGDVTDPKLIRKQDGTSAYRILYLNKEIEPHKASLAVDYQKLQILTLENKKKEAIENWALENSKKVFIYLNAPYNNCEGIQDWLSTQ